MLNNMVASFTASNMVGESMKQGRSNSKPKNLAPTTPYVPNAEENPSQDQE
jgi:hypothetical protein